MLISLCFVLGLVLLFVYETLQSMGLMDWLWCILYGHIVITYLIKLLFSTLLVWVAIKKVFPFMYSILKN